MKRVTVCGAGTLGAHLVEHLVREGGFTVTIIDHDRVEAANLANQPYQRHHIGQPKVRALEDLMLRANRGRVEPMHKRLRADNAERLLSGAEVVVDMFDNQAGRRDVHEACMRLGIPCLHAGMHPSGYAEVMWGERYVVPADSERDACTQPLARAMSLLVVAVCARSLEDVGARRGWTITWRDMRVEAL